MRKVVCFAADHLFFVQEMGILYAKLLVWVKFVQEMGILCAKLLVVMTFMTRQKGHLWTWCGKLKLHMKYNIFNFVSQLHRIIVRK